MDNNHGHTVAAWVTTILAISGSTVASVAFVIANVNVAIFGIGQLAAGMGSIFLIVGAIFCFMFANAIYFGVLETNTPHQM